MKSLTLFDGSFINYINATYFIADLDVNGGNNDNIIVSTDDLERYQLFKRLFIEIYKLNDIVVARNQDEADIIWNHFNEIEGGGNKTVVTFSGYIKHKNATMQIRDFFK
jgi:hypothetical protein